MNVNACCSPWLCSAAAQQGNRQALGRFGKPLQRSFLGKLSNKL